MKSMSIDQPNNLADTNASLYEMEQIKTIYTIVAILKLEFDFVHNKVEQALHWVLEEGEKRI
jgi:hypothetical protein